MLKTDVNNGNESVVTDERLGRRGGGGRREARSVAMTRCQWPEAMRLGTAGLQAFEKQASERTSKAAGSLFQ